jgi:hypothetical protein
MNRAFILCRPSDYSLAILCKERMTDLGWLAAIMIDPSEWDAVPENELHASYGTQGRGMFGRICALGISDGILSYSHPNDVVMKIDCDVRLSPEMSEWFKSGEKARCLKINRRTCIAWGGVWSATREHLVEAYKHISDSEECRCPESVLHIRGLNLTRGVELHETEMAQEWLPENNTEFAHVTTLPIARGIDRQGAGKALFGHHLSVDGGLAL